MCKVHAILTCKMSTGIQQNALLFSIKMKYQPILSIILLFLKTHMAQVVMQYPDVTRTFLKAKSENHYPIKDFVNRFQRISLCDALLNAQWYKHLVFVPSSYPQTSDCKVQFTNLQRESVYTEEGREKTTFTEDRFRIFIDEIEVPKFNRFLCGISQLGEEWYLATGLTKDTAFVLRRGRPNDALQIFGILDLNPIIFWKDDENEVVEGFLKGHADVSEDEKPVLDDNVKFEQVSDPDGNDEGNSSVLDDNVSDLERVSRWIWKQPILLRIPSQFLTKAVQIITQEFSPTYKPSCMNELRCPNTKYHDPVKSICALSPVTQFNLCSAVLHIVRKKNSVTNLSPLEWNSDRSRYHCGPRQVFAGAGEKMDWKIKISLPCKFRGSGINNGPYHAEFFLALQSISKGAATVLVLEQRSPWGRSMMLLHDLNVKAIVKVKLSLK